MSSDMRNPPGFAGIGYDLGTTAPTTYALDAALGTKVFALQFISPVSQTSANLTFHILQSATTGSPSDIQARCYTTLATNVCRVDAALGTAAVSVDCSSASPAIRTWVLTGVTLVQNQTYIILIWNNTETPGSNYPTFVRTSAIGTPQRQRHRCSSAGTNGVDGDLTWSQAVGPFVLKFGAGMIVGNGLLMAEAHASNTNWRGNRYQVRTPTTIVGAWLAGAAAATTNSHYTLAVYSTVGSLLASGTGTSGPRCDFVYLSSPYTLVPGVSYDIVFQPSANTSTGAAGYAGVDDPPADVTAARPTVNGTVLGLVNGTTPGSFTPDTKRYLVMQLVVDDFVGPATFPAAADVRINTSTFGPTGAEYTPTLKGIIDDAGNVNADGVLEADGTYYGLDSTDSTPYKDGADARKVTDSEFLEDHKDEIITSDTDILGEFGVTGTAAGGALSRVRLGM